MTGLIGGGLLGEDRLIVTADGRRLRAMVAGDGGDLVVLEAGMGVSGLYWGPVHQEVGSAARVIAYERAGFGSSDPDPGERDLARLVSDLRTVIEAVPHERLVLVGHSWGGPIVRMAAAQLAAEGASVAGLVLVDVSDENAAHLYLSRLARWSTAMQGSLLEPMARVGLLTRLSTGLVAGVPEPLRGAVIAASSSVSAARAAAAEAKHLIRGIEDLRDHPPRAMGVPLSVISGLVSTRVDRGVRAQIVAAHRETARQNPGARFVPAARSGHMVPVSEPELIAAEALAFLRS